MKTLDGWFTFREIIATNNAGSDCLEQRVQSSLGEVITMSRYQPDSDLTFFLAMLCCFNVSEKMCLPLPSATKYK
jgi:hypothetical protein